MNLGDVLQALADNGATPAQLVAAVRAEEAARVRAAEAALVERRAKAAERQRRKRERDAEAGTTKRGGEPELPFPNAPGQEESRGVTPVTSDSPSLSPSPRPPSTNPSPDPPYSPPLGDFVRAEEAEDLARFEAAWSAYPHAPGRSSRPKALAEWGKLASEVRAALPAAAARYRAEGREPRMDCGAKRFELWLRDGRYLDWMARPGIAAAPTRWAGPADLRAEVVAAAGEGFAKAYLDPSGWRAGEEGGEIIPRTGTAAERLTRDLRKLLAARGVTVRRAA